eukprot:3758519-Pleurochrysis_carterae.AAC.1
MAAQASTAGTDAADPRERLAGAVTQELPTQAAASAGPAETDRPDARRVRHQAAAGAPGRSGDATARSTGDRGAAAMMLARQASDLGLVGALGQRRADQWRGGQPSDRARRRMEELRTASRVHVLEATDARRTATPLRWFRTFLESTECVAFVDPAQPGGAAYNLDTLALFVKHIRRGGM